MGEWIAGCDICQEVCPYNRIGARNPLPVRAEYEPDERELDQGLDLLEVLSWTAEDRARVFRGSALKRIKLDMIRRNALIAAGNVLAEREDAALREAVEGCRDDESELVRATARQVLARLGDASNPADMDA
jgi:epoxyqueuosine reductase